MSDHSCEVCGMPVERQNARGPWPKRHKGCRAERAITNGNGHVAPDEEAQSAHDVVDAFKLDYNLGSTVRYILERGDGDELENLENAKVYLDRAIARLSP